ncbi:MAG: lipoate--protein ligase family protein [Nitrospira sp.]
MRALRLLDLTLPSPTENLALDNALLDELEEQSGDPVLRFWESDRYFVVLGPSCRLSDDVHADACEQDAIPVLRRASGGGTVLQGPGCLSYAFVLPLTLHPDLSDIRATNRLILERIARALHRWEPATAFRGISDLAIDGKKVSGNAQRRTRHALLFHGTVLHAMSGDLITRYLKQPARQPDYRADRPHGTFLRTIEVSPTDLKLAIAGAWDVGPPLDRWPEARMPGCIRNVLDRTRNEPLPGAGDARERMSL